MSYSDESTTSLMERELKNLRPLAPDPELCLRMERRMQQALHPRPTASSAGLEQNTAAILPFSTSAASAPLPKSRSWQKLAPWAAAAAVAAVSVPQFFNKPVAVESSQAESVQSKLQKVRAKRQMQHVKEEGIVLDPQQGALRSIRFQYNNNFEIDNGGGQKLGYQYPTEERMMLPLKFY
jgi:hypothetical protein